MEVGAFTQYFDIAQVVLYVFWGFFFGLVLYLHREGKREGYPLESDRSNKVKVEGFPGVPPPKTYLLPNGHTVQAPRREAPEKVNAEPIAPWPGAPLEPIGDPMLAGVGTGSYAEREKEPERNLDGSLKIQPLRTATEFSLERRDPDPRGMAVKGADGEVAGTVADAWVDLTEPQVRYLEVDLGESQGNAHVMLPMPLARIDGYRREVRVRSLMAHHFANVPRLANPDEITLDEEERVVAYYGAGQMFADPSRRKPRW